VKPLPWSPSALETFKNCPKQHHHRYVLKDLPEEEKSAEQIYGERVHEAFADRQRPIHRKLPADLAAHESFMQQLAAQEGVAYVEHKAALAKSSQPCEWSDEDVWCRMIIDYLRVDAKNRHATIVDYKTGKSHNKFNQLMIYALWVFQNFRYVETIDVMFYWTQTRTTTHKTYSDLQADELWGSLIGDLRQYRDAFRSNTWQMRPSGLCNGWCPVINCKHWRPKR